ncbi:hypothetical protein T440DRAFT_527926 [Plenodomus tracheiphilus IPT5]|uniref:Uncharacterized protein n=1 Tax=Plenodomus tracheiphilus IPT5 TaxID=1408161 RepID=A0A6A7ALT1_9PLEO|nr:hypothetical protein T440DRAFT_527926 [Plenodomus tracheiphilus IPT5]
MCGHEIDCMFNTYKTGSGFKCFCGPTRKKLRRKDPKEVKQEVIEFALIMRKKYALDDIFAESRSARISAAKLPNNSHRPTYAEVVFTPPVPLPHPDASAAAYINSRGLDHILDEMLHLSGERCGDGTFVVHDGERQENPIIITSQGPKNRMKLSGENVALKRLFTRLRDSKLLHTARYSPVDLCWKKAGGVGSFSEQTGTELTAIINKLNAGYVNGGVSLTVRQYMDGGKKLQWA